MEREHRRTARGREGPERSEEMETDKVGGKRPGEGGREMDKTKKKERKRRERREGYPQKSPFYTAAL